MSQSFTKHPMVLWISLQKGFTVPEILTVVFIVAVLSGLAFSSFTNVRSKELLDKNALQIVSFLEEARTLTLSAKGGESFGVHFETGRIVRFPGLAYSQNDPRNISLNLDPAVSISSINLASGGSDVLFKKLRGTTEQPGFVTLTLLASTTQKKIITVGGTGVVGVE